MARPPEPPPELPPELCDRIVDFLHDDRAALRACGLVCRQWAPAARHHLFSAVTVYQDADDVPKADQTAILFARFFRMLNDNRDLLPHFASVRIHRCHNELATRALRLLAPSRATELHVNALPDIFSETPVDLALARDFASLRSLALSYVLFETLDELVAQINPLRHLEELDMRHVYIKIPHSGLPRTWQPPRHAGAVDTLAPRFARCVAHLMLSDYSPESSLAALWPWLRAAAPALAVESLRADIRDGKRILPKFLRLHASSLTSLSLRIRDRGEEAPDVVPPELALCTRLESLTLQIAVSCVRDPSLPPPVFGNDFVLAAANSLSGILPGRLQAFRLSLLDVRDERAFKWAALDPLPWPDGCVCTIDLSFDTLGVPPASMSQKMGAERLLRHSLRTMISRGLLHISVD